MLCPRCKIEMKIGSAIKPNVTYGELTIVPVAPIRARELEVIKVLKCPKCGYSDNGKE